MEALDIDATPMTMDQIVEREQAIEKRWLEQFREQHQDRFRVVPMASPFNFSQLINAAAAEAQGEYLLLLNNDTEVIDADWLSGMIEQAQQIPADH